MFGPVGLLIESRSSESPWISSVWTSRSEHVTEMTSIASETWGVVFWESRGVAAAGIVGPGTRAESAPVPEDATFVGIQFSVGTSLAMAPTTTFVDTGVELPDATSRRFWLGGERWWTPSADDAELLVERFVRGGILVRDPIASAVLEGRVPPAASRTVERRFRAATGLTQGAVTQIARARTAAELLSAGATADAVVHRLGYYDEPHLARALRRYVGRTAGQLRERAGGAIALEGLSGDLVHGLQDPVGVGC